MTTEKTKFIQHGGSVMVIGPSGVGKDDAVSFLLREQLTPAQASEAQRMFYEDPRITSPTGIMARYIRLEGMKVAKLGLKSDGACEPCSEFPYRWQYEEHLSVIAELKSIWHEKLTEAAKI